MRNSKSQNKDMTLLTLNLTEGGQAGVLIEWEAKTISGSTVHYYEIISTFGLWCGDRRSSALTIITGCTKSDQWTPDCGITCGITLWHHVKVAFSIEWSFAWSSSKSPSIHSKFAAHVIIGWCVRAYKDCGVGVFLP
jgi:hypothetical protein